MIALPTITDHFGYTYLTPIKSLWRRGFHSGIDCNGKGAGDSDLGQKINAFGKGRVVFASSVIMPGWGRVIIIEHWFKNALGKPVKVWGRYAHLEKVLVKVGDIVKEEQLIATMGKTGTQSAHLHFDLMKEDPKNKFYQYVWGMSRVDVMKKYADIIWASHNWTH